VLFRNILTQPLVGRGERRKTKDER